MSNEDALLRNFESTIGKTWETLCDTFLKPGQHETLIKKLKRAPSDCPDFLLFLMHPATTPFCKRPNYYSLITDWMDKDPKSLPNFLRKTFNSVSDAERCFNAFIENTGIVYSTPAPRATTHRASSFFGSPYLASPPLITEHLSPPVRLSIY